MNGVESHILHNVISTQGCLTRTGDRIHNNGNTLTETLDGDTKTYQYNGKNQLTQASKAGNITAYTYNPNGIRNSKTEGGVTTRFIVNENRDYAQVLEEITNGTIATIYSYGHDLISQDKNGATSFYHYDGLGSTRALSDTAGMLTDSYDYEAFGEVINQTGNTENSYLFTGEQFDQGLNQYYLRARYYNQQIGRFTQMDTWMGNNQDPITLHKYAYGNADPATYTDPTGNFGLGSFGVSFSIQGALTAVSIGSSAYDIFMVTTGQQELTASDVGMHLLLGGAGKLAGKLGQRYADSLLKFVKGLGCNSFASDTLITTEAGLVEIQDIDIGDMVLTLNEETGMHEYRKVIHLIGSTELKEIIRIKLSNGAVIESTPGHLIYADRKWVAAENVHVGQSLYSLGNGVTVSGITASEDRVKVYNLTVDGNHNYFVGEDGILAHNISPCEKAAKELSRLIPKKCLGNGQCKQFAKEFEALLTENKVKGKRICLKTKFGIFSDALGLIGDTGLHAAVQVGELVFDNNNPKGIPYKDWLKDLGGESFIQPPGRGAQIDLHFEELGVKSNCLD